MTGMNAQRIMTSQEGMDRKIETRSKRPVLIGIGIVAVVAVVTAFLFSWDSSTSFTLDGQRILESSSLGEHLRVGGLGIEHPWPPQVPQTDGGNRPHAPDRPEQALRRASSSTWASNRRPSRTPRAFQWASSVPS